MTVQVIEKDLLTVESGIIAHPGKIIACKLPS